jgi:hypothetical protein
MALAIFLDVLIILLLKPIQLFTTVWLPQLWYTPNSNPEKTMAFGERIMDLFMGDIVQDW